MQERRYTTDSIEFRGRPGTGALISGHASVFDTPYEVFDFTESVSRGAFKKSIREADIRALWNHDPNVVLGRNKAKTLRLEEDDVGLRYEIDLPDTQAARDLYTLIERGDVSQSSFAFEVVKDAWDYPDDAMPSRTLKEVKLYDVSPVTYPASPATDVDVKRAMRSLAQVVDRPYEELLRAIEAGEWKTLWTPEPRSESIADTTPEPESEPSPAHSDATPEPGRTYVYLGT